MFRVSVKGLIVETMFLARSEYLIKEMILLASGEYMGV